MKGPCSQPLGVQHFVTAALGASSAFSFSSQAQGTFLKGPQATSTPSTANAPTGALRVMPCAVVMHLVPKLDICSGWQLQRQQVPQVCQDQLTTANWFGTDRHIGKGRGHS